MFSLVLLAEKFDFAAKCGFMVKIAKQEYDVSWDFICMNMIAALVPLIQVNYSALPWPLMVFHLSMVAVPVISWLLFPNTMVKVNMPWYFRWPALALGSGVLALLLSVCFTQNPFYLFHLYTDLLATIPQAYFLLHNPQEGEWNSAVYVCLLTLSRIAHAVDYLVHDLDRIFSKPQVLSHIVATFGGLLSVAWWYRKRISYKLCQVLWGMEMV